MKNSRAVIIIIIFLLIVQCFSLKGQTSKEVEKLVDKAVELIKEKNYKKAISVLEEARSKDKNYWPVYLYTGMACHFNTDYSNAISYYKIFIANDGKNPKIGTAFYNIGDCYYRTGNKEKAVEYLEKARVFFYNNNEMDYYIRSLKKLVDITSGSVNKKYKEELSKPLPTVTPTATKTSIPTKSPTIPFTPTPANTPTPVEDMVIIEAGEFSMGSNEKDRHINPVEEEHTVYLNSYKIDIYEVTNSQYCKFLNERKAETDSSEYKWINIDNEDSKIVRSEGKYTVKSGYEHYPVTFVSWYGAEAYGKWCNKRLPTEAEWERAAKGKKGYIYPWGDTWDPLKCANNTEKNGSLKPGGTFRDGASEDKLMDMAGNLFEWCSDWYSDDYYSMSKHNNPPGPSGGTHKSIRGGSWKTENSSHFRTTSRSMALPGTNSPYIGFRMVKEVKSE